MQGSLFATGFPELNPTAAIERVHLDDHCWIDTSTNWLLGGDDLLRQLIAKLEWTQGNRLMWGNLVPEPRLSGRMRPSDHPVVSSVSRALKVHYGEPFDTVFCNYYRDGSDSVAWHGDRIGHLVEPQVAIVSLGGPRRFLIRPRGGGSSTRFDLASGDLLVMGGRCQQRFEHAVPKAAHAQPRISVTLRRRRRS